MAHDMAQLLDIMRRLRSEHGCPWDRQQTLDSLRPYLIEECYEVLDAMDSGDAGRHAEELGDLLLQIVFQAQIRAEEGTFDFDDVVDKLYEKLVRRHPHVFGSERAADAEEVLGRWEQIKAREGRGRDSVLDGVPPHLPALMRAHQVQSRASRVGFDWTQAQDVLAKVEEELAEVRAALREGRSDRVRDEIGDLLFAVVNLSRFQKLHAEELLRHSVDKFARRFRAVEVRLKAASKSLADCTLDEMDAVWAQVKREEAAGEPSRSDGSAADVVVNNDRAF